ncbi:hypothetical protein ACVDFE_35880 [Lentzea chajnantorensis]
MTAAFVKVLTHTVKNCPNGCDLKTVLVDPGYGDPVRVHAGTYEYACPRTPGRRR